MINVYIGNIKIRRGALLLLKFFLENMCPHPLQKMTIDLRLFAKQIIIWL